jgi:hypothetical protein
MHIVRYIFLLGGCLLFHNFFAQGQSGEAMYHYFIGIEVPVVLGEQLNTFFLDRLKPYLNHTLIENAAYRDMHGMYYIKLAEVTRSFNQDIKYFAESIIKLNVSSAADLIRKEHVLSPASLQFADSVNRKADIISIHTNDRYDEALQNLIQQIVKYCNDDEMLLKKKLFFEASDRFHVVLGKLRPPVAKARQQKIDTLLKNASRYFRQHIDRKWSMSLRSIALFRETVHPKQLKSNVVEVIGRYSIV